jgi:hypothetical protein
VKQAKIHASNALRRNARVDARSADDNVETMEKEMRRAMLSWKARGLPRDRGA